MFKSRILLVIPLILIALTLNYNFSKNQTQQEMTLSFEALEWIENEETLLENTDAILKGKVVNISERIVSTPNVTYPILVYEFEIVEALKLDRNENKSIIEITMLNDPGRALKNNEEYVVYLQKNKNEDSYTPTYSRIFKENNGHLYAVFGTANLNYNTLKQDLAVVY